MIDIPEDVLKAAREINAAFWDEMGLTNDAVEIRSGVCDKSTEIALAARAIMAERERCARIIEENDEWLNQRTSSRSLAPRMDGNPVGLAYAAAIRKSA